MHFLFKVELNYEPQEDGSTSGRRAPAGSGKAFALCDWDLKDPTGEWPTLLT